MKKAAQPTPKKDETAFSQGYEDGFRDGSSLIETPSAPQPVTAASHRVERLRRQLVILEGLVRMLDTADRTGDGILSDSSEVVLAAYDQLDCALLEIAWLTEIQDVLEAIPAPDSDERKAGAR